VAKFSAIERRVQRVENHGDGPGSDGKISQHDVQGFAQPRTIQKISNDLGSRMSSTVQRFIERLLQLLVDRLGRGGLKRRLIRFVGAGIAVWTFHDFPHSPGYKAMATF
jgi:hypothetical protein